MNIAKGNIKEGLKHLKKIGETKYVVANEGEEPFDLIEVIADCFSILEDAVIAVETLAKEIDKINTKVEKVETKLEEKDKVKVKVVKET